MSRKNSSEMYISFCVYIFNILGNTCVFKKVIIDNVLTNRKIKNICTVVGNGGLFLGNPVNFYWVSRDGERRE